MVENPFFNGSYEGRENLGEPFLSDSGYSGSKGESLGSYQPDGCYLLMRYLLYGHDDGF
jgi:hypothetical protein